MKNNCRLALIFLLILSMLVPCAAAAQEDTDAVYAGTGYQIAVNAGLYDMGEGQYLAADKTVSRGEFAQVIANCIDFCMNSDSMIWRDAYFETDENQLLTESEDKYRIFEDVPSDHTAYDAVKTLKALGIMNGTSDTVFGVDENVCADDAITVLLRIGGYKMRADAEGGYPNGYLAVAKRLKLFAGVGYEEIKSSMTAAQLAEVIYNYMDVPVMQLESIGEYNNYTAKDDETFGTEVLNLHKLEGVMDGNDMSHVSSSNSCTENYVSIDGTEYSLGSGAEDAWKYLGRYTEGYYRKNDKTKEKEIVYIGLTAKDKSVTISHDEFLSYHAGTGSITVSYEQNGSNKTIDISRKLPVIYNGVYADEYDMDIFDLEYGSMTVSKNNGKDICVIIWEYDTYIVSGVTDDSIVADNESYEIKEFSLKPEDGVKVIYIGVSEGVEAKTEENDVLNVAETASSKVVYVTKAASAVSLTIDSVYENDYVTVKSEGVSYRLSPSFARSQQYQNIKSKTQVKAYFDMFGNIAWMTAVQTSPYSIGYLITFRTQNDAWNDEVIAKMFSFADDTVVEMSFAEKVKVSDSQNVTKTFKVSELEPQLNKSVVQYGLNEDNEINYIEFPLSEKDGEGRLYTFGTERFSRSIRDGGWTNGEFVIDSGTKILSCPDDALDYDGYFTMLGSSKSKYEMVMSAYSTNPDSFKAELIVSQNLSASLGYNNLCAVTDVYETVDENGERIKVVEGANMSGTAVKFISSYDYTDKNGRECTLFDVVEGKFDTNDAGEAKTYSLDKGDIAFISAKSDKDREATGALLYWDADMENPYKAGGMKGYMPGKTEKLFVRSELVDYTNNKNYMYDPDALAPLKGSQIALNGGNPYSNLDENYTHSNYYDQIWNFSANTDRVICGYVLNKEADILEVTTCDITQQKYDPSGIPVNAADREDITVSGIDYSGVYVTNLIKTSAFVSGWGRVTMNLYNSKVETKVLASDDARPYSQYGNECSRVLCMMSSGYPRFCIIINDYRR